MIGWEWFDSDVVLIEARNQTGTEAATNEPIFDDAHPTQVYNGAANVWIDKMTPIVLEAGEMLLKELHATFESHPTGIAVGQRLTYNGERFRIDSVQDWAPNDPDVATIEVMATNQEAW